MKTLLNALHLDAVVGIDFETYYDADYGLKKLATTDYIVDPRFKMQMASVQWHNEKRARVFNSTNFKRFCRETDWKRTGMLAHHCQFDALILSHHFRRKPAFYLDTLSMARPIMPVQVGGSLDALCKAFNLTGKVGAAALLNVMGVRDFTLAQYKALAKYAGNDIEQTWALFHKLRFYVPIDELKLIDLTIKMYAQPSLLVDQTMIDKVNSGVVEKKESLITALKVSRDDLMSNERFAVLLRKEGVEPPQKVSERTGKVALALSKQDIEFKRLLTHKKKRVRALVEARFAVKSTLLEARTSRMSRRAPLGAQPVYLKYWGAKTGRWAGGDASNWQNLTSRRKEGGAELRTSIHAPVGHVLVIADLAQIEARVNAWISGQQNILEAFRAFDIGQGPDVYRYTAATAIYNKPIGAVTDAERFVGKTCVLALGYQAGAPRFAEMLRIGSIGPPVDITDSLAHDIVQAWRSSNQFIVANWKRTQNNAKSAFMCKQRITDGVFVYEGFEGKGMTHLPGDTSIRYDGLDVDEEGMFYVAKYRMLNNGKPSIKRQRLYGGILVENNVQALARRILADQILETMERLPRARLAMTTHDEIVLVVPVHSAIKAQQIVTTIMSTPPKWAPDLPLAVQVHLSKRYDK